MPSLLSQLDTEWDSRLGHNRAVAAKLPEILTLTNSSTLDEAREWTHGATASDADQVLVALVARAVEGDTLAARVLLQFLMPGVRRMVTRWAPSGQRDEFESMAVASVYERIRSYPLANRPRKVAANVLLDAVRPLRNAVCSPTAQTITLDVDVAAADEAASAEELIETIAHAVEAGHITLDEAQIIVTTRILGGRLDDIAAEEGRTPRTLQRRRRDAESALAAAGNHL